MTADMGQEKVYIYKAPASRKLTEVKWFNPGLEIGLVFGLFGLALALRLYHLTDRSFWYDEATDARLAYETPFWQTFSFHLSWVVHPPMFYVIMHLWSKLVGMGEFGLRFFSVLTGLANLCLVYYLTRHWLTRRIALTTLLLLAISPLLLHWSQEFRQYSWLGLQVSLSMWLALRVSEQPEKNWRWFWYGLSASALIYLHYLSFHVIFAQLIFFVIVLFKNWKALLRLGLTLLLVAASFVPYLGNFLEQARNGPSFYVSTDPAQILQTYEQMVAYYIPNSLKMLVGAVFFGLFVTGLVELWRKRRNLAIWLFTWAILPVITSWLSSLIRPNFSASYFSFTIPPILILVATGLWSISGPDLKLSLPVRYQKVKVRLGIVPWLLFSMAVILSLVCCYNYIKYYRGQEWRSVVNYVIENSKAGDLVLMANRDGYASWPFDYYYKYIYHSPGNLERGAVYGTPTPEKVTDLVKDHQRVWAVSIYDFEESIKYAEFMYSNLENDNFNSIYYHQYKGELGTIGLSLFEKK